MYPRNAASPPRIAVGAVIQTSDGAVQSTGVSIVVRAEGGSETAGGGTTSYGASSSVVYYVPTQAETNYTAFVVTAYKTGCIPVSVTIITSATATAGTVDVGALGGDTAAATQLSLSASVIIRGTVSTAVLSPTTTAFAADDITEATADHYLGRSLIFTSGALLGQATRITGYSLVSAEGNFAVVALTEAPANNDTFIIV